MLKPSPALTKAERDQLKIQVKFMQALGERLWPDPDQEKRRLIAAYASLLERRRTEAKWIM